jgi:hypothetical protein
MTKAVICARVAAALTVAVAAVATPVSASVAAPSGGTAAKVAVGAQFHGTWSHLCDVKRAKVLDMLAGAGATWVRIDLGWTTIQPDGPGRFDMRWGVPFVDKVLNMATARGLKVMVMFWQTPGWANGNRDERILPTNVDHYADAIRFAAKRWSRQVQAWQVWNEPNGYEFLSPPDATAYTRLLRAAYPAVKAGNPDAKVVFGGTMYVDTTWIARAYAAGARGAFDVMAVHPYQGYSSKAPEETDRRGRERMTHTSELVRLMQRQGDGGKPIWFTEFGWSTHENTKKTPVWQRGVSEAQQASYLIRALRMIQKRYPQVTHVFWYNSHDLATGSNHTQNRGLLRRDLTAKPALGALRCYLRQVCPTARRRT